MKIRHERLCKALFLGLGLIALVPNDAEAGGWFDDPFGFNLPGLIDPFVPPPLIVPLPDLIVDKAIAIGVDKALVRIRNIGIADAGVSFVKAENITGVGFGICGPIAAGQARVIVVRMGHGRVKGCHLYTLYTADAFHQVLELDEGNNRDYFGDHTCN